MSILAAKGYLASGIFSGIKKSKKLDLGLIYSVFPAASAGVFTTNKAKAAPVVFSQKNINSKSIRAVIANSGCANACTGKDGENDLKKINSALAGVLNIGVSSLLCASTGVIGRRLPAQKIISALPCLCNSLSISGAESFAKSILTTDTVAKQACAHLVFWFNKGFNRRLRKGFGND